MYLVTGIVLKQCVLYLWDGVFGILGGVFCIWGMVYLVSWGLGWVMISLHYCRDNVTVVGTLVLCLVGGILLDSTLIR